jgi:hypothetical protein
VSRSQFDMRSCLVVDFFEAKLPSAVFGEPVRPFSNSPRDAVCTHSQADYHETQLSYASLQVQASSVIFGHLRYVQLRQADMTAQNDCTRLQIAMRPLRTVKLTTMRHSCLMRVCRCKHLCNVRWCRTDLYAQHVNAQGCKHKRYCIAWTVLQQRCVQKRQKRAYQHHLQRLHLRHLDNCCHVYTCQARSHCCCPYRCSYHTRLQARAAKKPTVQQGLHLNMFVPTILQRHRHGQVCRTRCCPQTSCHTDTCSLEQLEQTVKERTTQMVTRCPPAMQQTSTKMLCCKSSKQLPGKHYKLLLPRPQDGCYTFYC